MMAGFLPNHPCLNTYSDHLWTFDHDSIVWNLSRSFWSSHAQSSWLLISMFTEKATRSLFGSCPLLVVYHSDVLCQVVYHYLLPLSRKDLLHLRELLLQPDVQPTCHRQTLPGRQTALQVGQKGVTPWVPHQNMFFGGTPCWSNTKTALHIKMKTRFHQRWPFQNRAQDEHHKCHTFGEIYFHWKLDNFQDI